MLSFYFSFSYCLDKILLVEGLLLPVFHAYTLSVFFSKFTMIEGKCVHLIIFSALTHKDKLFLIVCDTTYSKDR